MTYCENNSISQLELINIDMLVSSNYLLERERERERDAGEHYKSITFFQQNFLPEIVCKFTILGKFLCAYLSHLFLLYTNKIITYKNIATP